jgi:hypothetical protein
MLAQINRTALNKPEHLLYTKIQELWMGHVFSYSPLLAISEPGRVLYALRF